MRIFVSEYVTGGGWREDARPDSLAAEGRAMLGAAVADFARLEDIEVVTTWDARVGAVPFQGAHVQHTESPEHEWHLFRTLAAECQATLVIAPEFDGVLQ